MSLMHTEFKDITIHTAKCDTCNKHNTKIMKQCVDCGQNFCTPCWHDRGSDGTHMLNSGDKGYAATKAQLMAKAKRARNLDLLKPKKEKISQMKMPTPRLTRRSKRTRRRTVVIEESESEDDGSNGDQMVLDEITSDEADGSNQLTLEPLKVSDVRRRKQRNVPSLLRETSTPEYDKASTSSTPAVTQPSHHPTMDDNDAANSLLYLHAGARGVAPIGFTPINASNAYNNIPHIEVSDYNTGSRCAAIYSPISPPGFTNSTDISNQQYSSLGGPSKPWISSPINSTHSSASTQTYPYPTNPGVTSTVIGHDSQGNITLTYQPPVTLLKHNDVAKVPTHNSDNIVQQDAKLNESLFLDPKSDEAICAISAGLPKGTPWSIAPTIGTSGLTSEEVDKLLKDMENMEGGMDERGARLFGNEAHGEVWDQQFDEPFLQEFEDGVEEHNAGAKANLDFGSRSRARRARVVRDDEELEDGEIVDDDEDSSS